MISLGGFTDSDGKFHPIPTIHPSLSAHVALQQPKSDSKSKRLAGVGRLIGSKTNQAIQKGKERKAKHDEEIRVKRQTTRFQINDVLESDAPAKTKFHRIQELMIRNKKYLQKEDYHIYNKRLAELHKEMVTAPKPQPVPENRGYKENDPFESLGEPSPDEKALNKLHQQMIQQRDDNEIDDKLSTEAKVSAQQ